MLFLFLLIAIFKTANVSFGIKIVMENLLHHPYFLMLLAQEIDYWSREKVSSISNARRSFRVVARKKLVD